MRPLLLSVLCSVTLVRSTPVAQADKSCQQYTLPLNVTSLNLKWAYSPIESNHDLAEYNTELARRASVPALHPFTLPTAPETAMYTISGMFCQPKNGGNGTVLLATHGGGFDGAYWDPSIQPEKYSFVDYVIAQGYSIFYYDRLGLGQSQMVSGYLPQPSLHAGVIKEIVKVLRSGKFGSPPSKVALVGHSQGSVYSNLVLNSAPELVDAAVLTGIAYNASNTGPWDDVKQKRLANLANPKKWNHLDGGWAVWVDIYANIEGFFKAPFYDRKVVQWAEDNKQPDAVLENFKFSNLNFSSPGFTGPIMIMSGEYDFIACGGYCSGILAENTDVLFPASKNLTTYVQPNSGHGINLSLNATGAFEVITNFLKDNGF